MIATLLCGSLAALTASPMALAQNRANSSGLPSASGNPLVQLQQQIDALAAAGQDVSELRQRLATLEQQMSALYGLQTQLNGLSTQLQTLSSQIGSGGGASLAVYDRNEKKMGDVVGVSEANVPWVSLTAGNRSFVLQVFPEQLVGQELWFENSNCTGRTYIAGWMLNNGPNVFALAAVQEPGGVVYAADANTPVNASVASFLDSNGNCWAWAVTQKVLPASAVMNLNTLFQRPYTVR
jgi:hypothetical protein